MNSEELLLSLAAPIQAAKVGGMRARAAKEEQRQTPIARLSIVRLLAILLLATGLVTPALASSARAALSENSLHGVSAVSGDLASASSRAKPNTASDFEPGLRRNRVGFPPWPRGASEFRYEDFAERVAQVRAESRARTGLKSDLGVAQEGSGLTRQQKAILKLEKAKKGTGPSGTPISLGGNVEGVSPTIAASDLIGASRSEIRRLAEAKGLLPSGDPDPVTGLLRKWKDPVTGRQRLRLDRGHTDPVTGLPYFDPKAAVDHAHGYLPNGTTKVRHPLDNNPHFPTTGE